ncbi:MAG: hypothetical protein WA555_00960 [Candidatus Sulfotelmatobacter sp.]
MTTLFLGWWGVISFVVTPFLVLGNIRAYVKCLSLPELTISAMNAPVPLHDVSRGGVSRGLILKVLYGTILWGTVGVLALQNSPQFLERHSPRLSTYLERLGLVDKQVPSGNVFGEHTLPDGTQKAERIEYPDGEKNFDVTGLPDGTRKVGRVELPNGDKGFDITNLQDGTVKVERVEHPDGWKDFDVTRLPDGTRKVGRVELPDGEKNFDVTGLPDGTVKVERIEAPDGEKDFNTITLPDGTYKAERVEFPDGEKWFEETRLQDGTEKVKRVEFPTGKKRFDVTIQGQSDTSTPGESNQYKIGQIYTGKTGRYKYIGGDPKSIKSWEKQKEALKYSDFAAWKAGQH